MKRIEAAGRIGRMLAVAGLALAIGGCAADRVGAPDREARSESRIRVENYNWADITVRIARDGTGMSQRLGTVGSQQTAQFTVPRGLMAASGRVRLIADPIGGADPFVTAPINVQPGETIEWTLEANLNLSSWTVR